MSRNELIRQIVSVSNKKRVSQILPTDVESWNLRCDAGSRSAVLVPICTYKGELSLLLTIRNMSMPTHKGQVSFPGGHEIKGEEYPVATALRETREETGLEVSRESVFAALGPIPNRRGIKTIAAVIADVGEVEKESLILDTNEVTDAFFLSFESILKEKNQRYTIFRNFGLFGMPVYLGGPRRVWGITGTIIDLVLELILPAELQYYPLRKRNWRI